MAVLYNFEIKLNRLFGGVGYFHGAQRWMPYPPSSVSSPGGWRAPLLGHVCPGETLGQAGEEGGRDTGPSQPLESRTGESDHEIACWTMTDWGTGGGGGAVECIRMVRKMGF